MSAAQRPNRRLSARLQEKDDVPLSSNRARPNGNVKTSGGSSQAMRTQSFKASNDKKRKMDYDEEDDGFLFKRVKKKKPEVKPAEREAEVEQTQNDASNHQAQTATNGARNDDTEPNPPPKKRKNKMSFSTPYPKEDAPVRRSKRLSRDNEQQGGSPGKKMIRQELKMQDQPAEEPSRLSPKRPNVAPSENVQGDYEKVPVPVQEDERSATKISLPFADTPVIKRNKAMREGKVGKGERRSSLGLRGRRASSLIETGNSNALPHAEVEIPDFYKHIESEGLPEPRRMRQLLTWCATRALDDKPKGTGFEDSSARSAARVIQEELLKDLANKSELSDWFGREDVPPSPQKPLPQRPNPKNVQNIKKIAELEEQIDRLRIEKEALEALLRPPSIPSLPDFSIDTLDRSLLSDADAAALDSIASDTASSDLISQRLNGLYESLGPTIDTFADGIHKIGQYRDAADNVAGRILAMCADKFAQREKEGRRRALAIGQCSPPKDLGGVLRSLSRADR